MSGAAAEFSVAIRSALLQPGLETQGGPAAALSVFTGVGIVPGSDASQEWAELELKVRPTCDIGDIQHPVIIRRGPLHPPSHMLGRRTHDDHHVGNNHTSRCDEQWR